MVNSPFLRTSQNNDEENNNKKRFLELHAHFCQNENMPSSYTKKRIFVQLWCGYIYSPNTTVTTSSVHISEAAALRRYRNLCYYYYYSISFIVNYNSMLFIENVIQ